MKMTDFRGQKKHIRKTDIVGYHILNRRRIPYLFRHRRLLGLKVSFNPFLGIIRLFRPLSGKKVRITYVHESAKNRSNPHIDERKNTIS
jgi:hypothetical protein